VDTGGSEVGARGKCDEHVPLLLEEGAHIALDVGTGSVAGFEVAGDGVVTTSKEDIADTTTVLTG
jgi:hypothetical protein